MDETNTRNFQILVDFCSQRRALSLLVVFCFCKWCIRVCVCVYWGGGEGGGCVLNRECGWWIGDHFSLKRENTCFSSRQFSHGHFQGRYFPDYHLQGNIFSRGSILDQHWFKVCYYCMKKTSMYFPTNFLVNKFCHWNKVRNILIF